MEIMRRVLCGVSGVACVVWREWCGASGVACVVWREWCGVSGVACVVWAAHEPAIRYFSETRVEVI